MKKILITLILIVNFIFAQSEKTSHTSIGGYGELHYNYSKLDNSSSKKELDFHRFVLFFSHQWNAKWSFVSELELEHNYVKGEKFGELELEQAYINYQVNDNLNLRGGVLLVSAGIINETHEPPTFLTVERSDYHRSLIPTTWFGNGIGVYGSFGDFNYTVNLMEGLNADKISSKGIRDARQKGFMPNAKGMLINTKLSYNGIDGLLLGTSFSYNSAKGTTQDNVGVSLFEIHSKYEANNIYFTGEFGLIKYNNINVKTSQGYYVDLGYNIGSLLNVETKIIPFISVSDVNTASETIIGGDEEHKFHNQKWLVGLSVKPIDEVVLKFDYGVNKLKFNNVKTTLMNFGIGYMF